MNAKFTFILVILTILCISTLVSALVQEKTVGDWLENGKILYDKASFEEAAGCFERAVKLDPTCAECWYRKGLALSYGGEKANHEEAIKCYDKALQLNPSYEDALNNKGYSLCMVGQLDEALDYVNRALKINSSDADAWDNKGIIYLKMKKYDEALKCYDKAIELAPNWGDPYYNKGFTLREMGHDANEYEPYFNKASELGTGED